MSKSLVSCFLTHSVDGGALANTTDTTCAGTVLSINDPSFPTKPAASFIFIANAVVNADILSLSNVVRFQTLLTLVAKQTVR